MGDLENREERITRFVLGEMSADVAQAFVAEMEGDATLAREVADYRALRADLGLVDEAGFLHKMQMMAAELRTVSEPAELEAGLGSGAEGQVIFWKKWWPYAVAAVLLLLLIPTLMLLRSPDNEALFSAYFSPYADVASGRGGNNLPTFLAGMQAYNAGDFAGALPYFKELLEAKPRDQDGLFYGGIAALAAGKPGQAIQRLRLLREQESIFQKAATWYQALAHLKAGDTAKARSLLAALAATTNSFQEQAISLIGKLPKD
ncbi:MAG TPA: hypothetical protein ENJ82_09210 [Bacteroidetes bacterium]|nr:hypothetical protein [Bacteroidota bacterium]